MSARRSHAVEADDRIRPVLAGRRKHRANRDVVHRLAERQANLLVVVGGNARPWRTRPTTSRASAGVRSVCPTWTPDAPASLRDIGPVVHDERRTGRPALAASASASSSMRPARQLLGSQLDEADAGVEPGLKDLAGIQSARPRRRRTSRMRRERVRAI